MIDGAREAHKVGSGNMKVTGNLDRSIFAGLVWKEAWLERVQEVTGGRD